MYCKSNEKYVEIDCFGISYNDLTIFSHFSRVSSDQHILFCENTEHYPNSSDKT